MFKAGMIAGNPVIFDRDKYVMSVNDSYNASLIAEILNKDEEGERFYKTEFNRFSKNRQEVTKEDGNTSRETKKKRS